jgi:heme/copper-type cytochrome/quinol oxidase subunit 2
MTLTIMKTAIIIIVGIILLTFLIVSFTKNKKKTDKPFTINNQPVTASITGQTFVDTLTSLGYFKYTDTKNLGTLKKEIERVFDKVKVLTTISEEKKPFQCYCYRLYSCDGETLFELGGVEDYLRDIKPTFDKLKIPLQWKDDHFSDDATKHSIIINDKKYFPFKGDPNDLRAWGIATKNFVEIINDQLIIHNSDERVYPILFNNDGHIIFLTEKQYHFVSQYLDKTERPMEINLWWQTFK